MTDASRQANAPHGRLVAVTGASRGIGSAMSRALAAAGYTVACLTRKGTGVEDCDVGELSSRMRAYRCDVTDDASVKEALANAVSDTGPLAGLVNNAGIHADGRSESFPTEEFRNVLDTNVAAIFAVARETYPHLIDAGGGLIVNIGSYYDNVGIPRHAAYCASKAAIGAITRCLAVEWADRNIQVVDVAPGFIGTDLNSQYMEHEGFRKYIESRVPVGRPGKPEEVADVVVNLFDSRNPYLTGSTIYVDGAHGIAI